MNQTQRVKCYEHGHGPAVLMLHGSHIDSKGAGNTMLAPTLPQERFSSEAAALYERNRAAMEQLKPHHRGDDSSNATIARRIMDRGQYPGERRQIRGDERIWSLALARTARMVSVPAEAIPGSRCEVELQ